MQVTVSKINTNEKLCYKYRLKLDFYVLSEIVFIFKLKRPTLLKYVPHRSFLRISGIILNKFDSIGTSCFMAFIFFRRELPGSLEDSPRDSHKNNNFKEIDSEYYEKNNLKRFSR